MKKKIAALIAMAAVMAVTVASCGKEPDESSVPELPSLTKETEPATEVATEAETEKATKASEEKTEAPEEATEADVHEPEDNETSESEDSKPEEDDASEQSEDPEPDPEPEPEPDPEPAPTQTVTFDLGMLLKDAGSYVSSLGTPDDVLEAPACFNNGADSKIYVYNGLTLNCYVLNGVENICGATITGGDYSTAAGIKVGSTQADVEAAYGAGDMSGDYEVYTDGDKELSFRYSAGTVTKIQFYVPV